MRYHASWLLLDIDDLDSLELRSLTVRDITEKPTFLARHASQLVTLRMEFVFNFSDTAPLNFTRLRHLAVTGLICKTAMRT